MPRTDGRADDEIRPVAFKRGFTSVPAGSCLVETGKTVVLCTASVIPGVPEWMRGRGQGWMTAEYSMLPGSTPDRKPRDATRGKIDGRTQEIQRLVGRALRAAVDMRNFGENTVWLDCDVLQADGGTRTAAVNGAYVALHDALKWMEGRGMLLAWPITAPVAAISVGIVGGRALADLAYDEDSKAEVDMNVVMAQASSGDRFVELQGTGERRSFTADELAAMLELARSGIRKVRALQDAALAR